MCTNFVQIEYNTYIKISSIIAVSFDFDDMFIGDSTISIILNNNYEYNYFVIDLFNDTDLYNCISCILQYLQLFDLLRNINLCIENLNKGVNYDTNK